jgi:predicted nuclease with TOPRIM domain
MRKPDYSHVNNVLSDNIRSGLGANPCDVMQAMTRVAGIQDDAYFEAFEEIQKQAKEQISNQELILAALNEVKQEIKDLRGEVQELRKEVATTKTEVDKLRTDVDILMKHDSFLNHAIRIAIGIVVGVIAFLEIHRWWLR